ncbi:MAG: type II toxin-antitoxin system VapC family toxin [Deltaproteobacteria bacterium]|nr:type II toxin-antitoxin system VapC family toxin [Deltaproteobacteria bacterium]
MTGVDTNILVRLLTRDNEDQFKKAFALFNKDTVFISDTVMLETEWVLRFAYSFKTLEICDAFIKLLSLTNVKTKNPDTLFSALEWTRKGLDFADALHLACCKDCGHFATFDSDFIRRSKGLSKCAVKNP